MVGMPHALVAPGFSANPILERAYVVAEERIAVKRKFLEIGK
jgi:hypothetical protein